MGGKGRSWVGASIGGSDELRPPHSLENSMIEFILYGRYLHMYIDYSCSIEHLNIYDVTNRQ